MPDHPQYQEAATLIFRVDVLTNFLKGGRLDCWFLAEEDQLGAALKAIAAARSYLKFHVTPIPPSVEIRADLRVRVLTEDLLQAICAELRGPITLPAISHEEAAQGAENVLAWNPGSRLEQRPDALAIFLAGASAPDVVIKVVAAPTSHGLPCLR